VADRKEEDREAQEALILNICSLTLVGGSEKLDPEAEQYGTDPVPVDTNR
jgi:hypothetical protein